MSRFIIEGESFFALSFLKEITKGKKVSYQQDHFNTGSSFFKKPDFYIFFEMNKDLADSIVHLPFIVCNLDKNFDLRTDWVKKLKNNSEYKCFDPIPSTDFQSLKRIFPSLSQSQFLPVKKTPLKYKNTKQNYEWFNLDLINDLLPYQKFNIFQEIGDSYFDIWAFTDALWNGDHNAIKYIQFIDQSNFEEYFNRIRETIKDYVEVVQSESKTFHAHVKSIDQPIVNNEYRFNKIKSSIMNINQNQINLVLSLYDECLKNVRLGANPKLELIKLFFQFKDNVK